MKKYTLFLSYDILARVKLWQYKNQWFQGYQVGKYEQAEQTALWLCSLCFSIDGYMPVYTWANSQNTQQG